MSKGKHGAVAAVTLALAIVSAVWLTAMGVAGEEHVALVVALATARPLP
ncbi:hypothetical protein [uncultured Azohydromonas sp.]|nr:hypothetical protein [uncultured Azohydromonas sp.]